MCARACVHVCLPAHLHISLVRCPRTNSVLLSCGFVLLKEVIKNTCFVILEIKVMYEEDNRHFVL
jgi:hypothetical protein